MRLETGKFYRARNGYMVGIGPIHNLVGQEDGFKPVTGLIFHDRQYRGSSQWYFNGCYSDGWVDHPFDLVAEWTIPYDRLGDEVTDTGSRMIDVRTGDVYVTKGLKFGGRVAHCIDGPSTGFRAQLPINPIGGQYQALEVLSVN